MKRNEVTPLMRAACLQAEAALFLAFEAVDSILDEDQAAVEHPELVVAFMTVAGAAYQALTISDNFDAIIDREGTVLQ
jgi:hypothetical protein